MKIKLDENLGALVKTRLKNDGQQVTTIAEEGLSSSNDKTVAEVCRQDAKCLLTLDLGFANPFQFPPSMHHGIAVLRVSDPITRLKLKQAVDTFLNALESMEFVGKLWIVEANRVRVYQPID